MQERDCEQVSDEAARLLRLEQRQGRLERQVVRWRAGAFGLAALLILGAAVSPTRFDSVETGELLLKDRDGKLRASLALRPDGTPGLAFFDGNQSVRLSLDLAGDGSGSVNLHDATGVVRAALAVRENGTPGLGLFDPEGTLRASVDLGSDLSSGINVFDPHGVIRAAMAVRPDGSPGFGLFNQEGQVEQSFELESGTAEVGRLSRQ